MEYALVFIQEEKRGERERKLWIAAVETERKRDEKWVNSALVVSPTPPPPSYFLNT